MAEDPHHIQPFRFEGDPAQVLPRLRRIIERQPRARVVSQEHDYLHAEFESRLFGFVDDVEFRLVPQERQVHVRSAARLGYSDFGVNRARLEFLREQFEGDGPAAATGP